MRVLHRILAWGSQPRVLLSPLVPLTSILPTPLPAPLSALGTVLLELFILFLPDVAVTLDCDIYPYRLPILLVHHNDIQLTNQHHLIGLDLEVPQDLSC